MMARDYYSQPSSTPPVVGAALGSGSAGFSGSAAAGGGSLGFGGGTTNPFLGARFLAPGARASISSTTRGRLAGVC